MIFYPTEQSASSESVAFSLEETLQTLVPVKTKCFNVISMFFLNDNDYYVA